MPTQIIHVNNDEIGGVLGKGCKNCNYKKR
jgi:hypothetical protein